MKQNTFIIFKGDSKTMNLKAIYAENFTPLDLTDCTEIDVALPLQGGGFLHKILSDDEVEITAPALLGKIAVPILVGDSILLNEGEYQNLDVTFTINGEIQTVRFMQALSVFENA